MTARLVIGAIWVGAVLATVATGFATRSQFAEVNPIGGAFIVVGCAVVVAVTVGLVRSPLVLLVTAVVAGVWASIFAWGVVHDESSTAALGVIGPPMLSAVVATVGIGISALIRTGRRKPSGA